MRLMVYIGLALFMSCCVSADGYADTIRTNDGKEIKGIVVEDFDDRIVFSTPDGEMTVKKSDISGLYFDSEEENLIKLAEQSRDKKDYIKSFIYYDKALKTNPASKKALEGVVFLQGYLFRKEQAQKEEDVKKREAIENFGIAIEEEPSDVEKAAQEAEKLLKDVGLAISIKSGLPAVNGVRIKSPAQEAGIKVGDKIIAVWGKLTGYLSLEDVIKMLTDKPSLELKCTIERAITASLAPGNFLDASFTMEFDGMTVSGVGEEGPAFNAGLQKADIITAINGKSIRYVPIKKAVDMIKYSRNRHVKLTVRREVVIWRKD